MRVMKIRRQIRWLIVGSFVSCLTLMFVVFIQGINHRPKVQIGMSVHDFMDVVNVEYTSAKHRWLPPFRWFAAGSDGDSVTFATHYYFRDRHEFLIRQEAFNFTNSILVSITPISSEWHYDF